MIGYNVFLKHAEAITRSVSTSRPILQGVFHKDNGSLYVSDSHRLYEVKNIHTLSSNIVINPKTGEKIEGNYPDVSRIIPDGEGNQIIRIHDVKQTIEAVDVLLNIQRIEKLNIKKTPKNLCVIRLSSKDQNVVLTSNTDVFTSDYVLSVNVEMDYPIDFRAEYLKQALSLFKDCGYFQVDLHLYGKNRPFVLTGINGNDEMKTLILPVKSK